MLNKVEVYFYSPTGGTKKVAQALGNALTENVDMKNMGSKFGVSKSGECDLVVLVVPVFSGRVPKVAADRIKGIAAEGKKVVTAVVYGVRAYEDALLELNDIAKEGGMEVVGSAALIAEHSMYREVGKGRPDAADMDEIKAFAEKVLAKLESGEVTEIQVPGNFPYKPEMVVTETPIFKDDCVGCGLCVNTCPFEAIVRNMRIAETDVNKCNLCMACVKVCQRGSRVLTPEKMAALDERLGGLKDVRRENEFYI